MKCTNVQNEGNEIQLNKTNCMIKTKSNDENDDITLCWDIWSSSLDVSVPMGSELARCFSVAASHSLRGSSVSWNC